MVKREMIMVDVQTNLLILFFMRVHRFKNVDTSPYLISSY